MTFIFLKGVGRLGKGIVELWESVEDHVKLRRKPYRMALWKLFLACAHVLMHLLQKKKQNNTKQQKPAVQISCPSVCTEAFQVCKHSYLKNMILSRKLWHPRAYSVHNVAFVQVSCSLVCGDLC